MAARADGALGGVVAGTTDYVFRGVSQTRGAPALQGGLHYRTDTGWFAGTWASTIDLNRGPGATLEIDLYGGRGWQLDEAWAARVTIVHYAYPNDNGYLRYDYDELLLSAAWRDSLVATLAWSPNTSRYSSYGPARNRNAYSVDLAGRWELKSPLALIASAGYYDLDDLFGLGYAYGSVGLAATRGGVELQAAYYFTGNDASDLFGDEVAGDRWALSLAWRF